MPLKLCLILILSLSSLKISADGLPNEMKPAGNSVGQPFFCTDRAGAEKFATCFRENKDCHDQIGKEHGGPDWIDLGIAFLFGAAVGVVILSSK